jgi:hypothetical protein
MEAMAEGKEATAVAEGKVMVMAMAMGEVEGKEVMVMVMAEGGEGGAEGAIAATSFLATTCIDHRHWKGPRTMKSAGVLFSFKSPFARILYPYL